ncbi:MAG: endonuclease domain-containing protein [Deltaproteobacteria bacterium]|nr:endonuclease domain-containing protein [Deltaproteobacteria bacterium]
MLHSARGFRHERTEGESAFWQLVRAGRMGAKFRRQHPLKGFIVDFCCAERCLVVEIDGGVHIGREAADAARSEALGSAGYRVIRFTNNDVLNNVNAVIAELQRALTEQTKAKSPPPSPLPVERGAGGERSTTTRPKASSP